jgi:hypothetical protein
MGWNGLNLVTDLELGQLEPQAIAPTAPWGSTTWPDARTEAKRDLRIWLERDYADIPGVCDRVLDRWTFNFAWGYTGSTYVDQTWAVTQWNENDVALATIFTTPANDRLYLAGEWEFEGIYVSLLDHLNVAASTLTAKYWNGKAWTAFGTVQDGTAASGATFGQSGRVSWVLPTDWERRRINGITGAAPADFFYWIELSVSGALTAATAASQIMAIRAPSGLKRVAQYLALQKIFKGLAAQSGAPEEWVTRSDQYEANAQTLYQSLLDKGGIPLDVNRSQSIDRGEPSAAVRPSHLSRG